MAWISEYQRWLSESESLQNAQLVANHLIPQGWTKESVSALCGNMRHESSINPDMYEFNYAWGDDKGYGLVQWTPRSKYWDWAESRNLPPRNGDSQLARIDYEVEQNIQWISTPNYPETYAQFRASTKSMDYLVPCFTWNYERPNAESGQQSMPDRIAFAKRCLNELDFSGSGGSNSDGRQLAVLPIDYVHVTQGEYGPFSHFRGSGQELAIDFIFPTNRYPAKAPFDIEVMDRRDNYATVVWKNTKPVMGANGVKYDELHIIVIHDWNFKDYKIGDKRKKGEVFYHSGSETGGGGVSTGDHLHLEVMKGHKYQFPPPSSNQLHIYEVFDTKHVKTWVDKGGYTWLESDFVDGEDGDTTNPDTPDKKDDWIDLLVVNAVNGWYN